MTDRLDELNVPECFADASPVSDDIETGRDGHTDAALAKFNREADAIDKVYVWANKSISTINASLSDPDALPSVAAQLDTIDAKLDAVRKRLKRIAIENKSLANSESTTPATLRIRVSRYTKLGNDFMAVVTSMQNLRETHKQMAADVVKRDLLRANPHANEAQVDRAVQSDDPAQLDAILQTNDPQLRHQLDDLRSRNRDIQNLSKNIVELHQMFTDMSILVETQQDLINDIEYNVKEVKVETKKAGDELVEALAHQRSARKKKMCIIIIVTCVVIAIVAIIVISVGSQNNWFSGTSSSSGTESPTTQPPTTNTANTNDTTNPTSTQRFKHHPVDSTLVVSPISQTTMLRTSR